MSSHYSTLSCFEQRGDNVAGSCAGGSKRFAEIRGPRPAISTATTSRTPSVCFATGVRPWHTTSSSLRSRAGRRRSVRC